MRIVNLLHIYLYSVLYLAAVLAILQINAENGASIVISIGLISGIGIKIIEEETPEIATGFLGIKNAMWYAIIAPFQVYKIKLK